METNWPTVNGWIGLSEGGFVNHKKDPGKATNHGITIFTLSDDLGRPATIQDVKNLTKAEAERILKSRYWDLVRGDELPSGLDYMVSDYGVNSGPAKAVKDLQRTLKSMGFKLKIDGLMGPQTLGVLSELSKDQAEELVRLYAKRRMTFLRGLGTWTTFGRGWTRRVMGERSGIQLNDIGVADRAMMMIEQRPIDAIPAPIPPTEEIPNGKAEPEQPNIVDALKKPSAWGPLAGLLSALGAVTQGSGPVQYALAALVVAFIVVGVFYAIRQVQNMDPA